VTYPSEYLYIVRIGDVLGSNLDHKAVNLNIVSLCFPHYRNGNAGLAQWTYYLIYVCVGGWGGDVRCIQACGGGNLRDKDHLEDLDIDERTIFKKYNFHKWDRRAWTGLVWLRTGTGGGLLWTR
jgi:hypothetical protein